MTQAGAGCGQLVLGAGQSSLQLLDRELGVAGVLEQRVAGPLEVLDPVDELGPRDVVEFGAEGELDSRAAPVPVSSGVCEFMTHQRELGLQAGSADPFALRGGGEGDAVFDLLVDGRLDGARMAALLLGEPGGDPGFAGDIRERHPMSGVLQPADGCQRAVTFGVAVAGLRVA